MNDKPKSTGLAGAVSRYFGATFQSLRSSNFRWYCLGILISLTGSLMQEIVVAWIAYKMTGSSFVLGSILFSYQVPMLVLGVLGGWAADRFDRKRIIVTTQFLALGISLTWLTLSATGNLAVWHLYLLSAFFGCIVAFEIPARFAMIPQMVKDEDCMNAFSLDSLLFYSGRVLGPATGALMLAAIGATGCFALNAASYVFELLTLARIRPAPRPQSVSATLKEGFAFTYGTPEVRRILIFVAVFSFLGVYVPLMPVFTTLLGGTERLNGLLIAASEIGAMIGSVYLANRTAKAAFMNPLKRYVGLAGVSYGVCLLAFALSRSIPLSLALIVPTGLSMTILLIGSHALIQDRTDDRMRGVVSTVFWMYSYFGMFALGGPTIGWLVEQVGVNWTIAGASAICISTAVWYLSKRSVPPASRNGEDTTDAPSAVTSQVQPAGDPGTNPQGRITMNLSEARIWCQRAHGDQKYGDHPYSYHLDAVEGVAVRFGFADDEIIRMSCQTHDTKEDRGVTREQLLTAGFPVEVADITDAVTDEDGATREEKKAKTLPKIAKIRKAIIVKLCDRIANVEESKKTNNTKKFQMYKKEQAELSRQLRDFNDKELEPLWNHLEGLFAESN